MRIRLVHFRFNNVSVVEEGVDGRSSESQAASTNRQFSRSGGSATEPKVGGSSRGGGRFKAARNDNQVTRNYQLMTINKWNFQKNRRSNGPLVAVREGAPDADFLFFSERCGWFQMSTRSSRSRGPPPELPPPAPAAKGRPTRRSAVSNEKDVEEAAPVQVPPGADLSSPGRAKRPNKRKQQHAEEGTLPSRWSLCSYHFCSFSPFR